METKSTYARNLAECKDVPTIGACPPGYSYAKKDPLFTRVK